jgi:hypothetical protein
MERFSVMLILTFYAGHISTGENLRAVCLSTVERSSPIILNSLREARGLCGLLKNLSQIPISAPKIKYTEADNRAIDELIKQTGKFHLYSRNRKDIN